MRRLWVMGTILGVLAGLASDVGAVVGEGVATTMAVKAQTVMQEARFKIMEIEMVKNTKILYDNYVQTKRYYDQIEEASKNRGGLLGYYKDRFMDRFNEGKYEEWRAIQKLSEGDEENAVRHAVEKGEAYLDSKVEKTADAWIDQMKIEMDAMVKAINNEDSQAKQRESTAKQLFIDAGRSGITDKQKDSLDLQASMLQIEYLASIDRHQRMDMAEKLASLTRELQVMQRNQLSSVQMSSLMTSKLRKQSGGNRAPSMKFKQDLLETLGEVPGR